MGKTEPNAAIERNPLPLNLLHWAKRRVPGLLALALVFAATYYVSYWLRFEGQIPPKEISRLLSTVGWVICIKLAFFIRFRVGSGWSRSVAFYDLVVLTQATTGSLLAMVVIDRYLAPAPLIPRSVFLMDWGATIVVIGGARSLLRTIRECNWAPLVPADQVPAVIVGANETGELLLRAMIRSGRRTYRVVGFIDNDAQRLGTRIAGVPVIGTLDETCKIAQRYGVEQILVASEGIPGRQIRDLIDDAQRYNMEVRVLPSFEQILSGRVAIHPRPVSIDDLLRREPVALNLESIRRWLDQRVLLVTGSAGSIGSEICRQLVHFSPRKLVMVDRSETGQFFVERELRAMGTTVEIDVSIADVLDRERIRDLLCEHRPDVVFHAAAYKHVPLMEAHPGEAVKNIVVATRQMAELSAEAGVDSFVLISTDKAVNPTSAMGACKRAAELYVQSLAEGSPCRFVTVRFGNVLDSSGSVVQIFRQQIAAGGPVTVTDPAMRRYFMTIPEAARLVIQAGALGQGGQILVLDMGEPVRIVDLAADMIRLSGLRVDEDVAIEFIGPRPGEKLCEQLHVAGERQLPTCHPKIIVADRQPANPAWIAAAIDELERLARVAPDRVFAQLERIVPEYRHLARPAGLRRAA